MDHIPVYCLYEAYIISENNRIWRMFFISNLIPTKLNFWMDIIPKKWIYFCLVWILFLKQWILFLQKLIFFHSVEALLYAIIITQIIDGYRVTTIGYGDTSDRVVEDNGFYF